MLYYKCVISLICDITSLLYHKYVILQVCYINISFLSIEIIYYNPLLVLISQICDIWQIFLVKLSYKNSCVKFDASSRINGSFVPQKQDTEKRKC